LDTEAFLRWILPAQGFYCLFVLEDRRTLFFDNVPSMAVAAQQIDRGGQTVFHACSSFATKTRRKADNAEYVRSLWADVDVGKARGPSYPTLAEAGAAFKQMLKVYGFPVPTLVASGGGLHSYFVFDRDVPAKSALPVMKLMKELMHQAGLEIDTSRAMDLASVLRPVGTHNFKYDPIREVKLLYQSTAIDFDTFAEQVKDRYNELPNVRKKKIGINAEFGIPSQPLPSSARLVAEKCPQIRQVALKKGNVSEPLWYATLGVIRLCTNGNEYAHRLSTGHPEYNREQTDAKLAQLEAYGPTLCTTFASRNMDGCAGCVHMGKISSPIQLGVQLTPKPLRDASKDDYVEPPKEFIRSEKGLHWYNRDKESNDEIYPYDLYLEEIAYDPAKKYEVAVIRHTLPKEGDMLFTMRSSDVADRKTFERSIRDHHVNPTNVALMLKYITAYMFEWRRFKKMRPLYTSLGWKNGTASFVLGQKEYFANGDVRMVGLSEAIAPIAESIKCKGDLETWVEQTKIFGAEKMAAHAFTFGIGFGSPLMAFTGLEGCMFNALGETSAGKTTVARFFTSIYGNYEGLELKKQDTENAKVMRLGAMGSLPVYIDEITNVDPDDVSNFIYEVTQGRSKLRLRIDASEREVLTWRLITLASSNSSIANKLRSRKANPDAELARLFEYNLDPVAAFDSAAGKAMADTFKENYGYAGERYIQFIVNNQELVRVGLQATIDHLRRLTGTLPHERFWVAGCACVLYGLNLARQLSLIRFELNTVFKWTVDRIIVERGIVSTNRFSPLALLGMYLNDNNAYRLAVRESGVKGGKEYTVEQRPQGAVYIRYDMTQMKLWIEQRHFNQWLVKQQEQMSKVKVALELEEVLKQVRPKSLGAGTEYASSVALCLEFDLSHPAMGNEYLKLVDPPVKEVA